MKRLLMGGFIIALGATGCDKSSCQTKTYDKGDHIRTVCSSADGLSGYGYVRHGGSVSFLINVDGDLHCTVTDSEGNKTTRRIEDFMDLHTGTLNGDPEAACTM